MIILFLHGWQSVVGGVKPGFLAGRGHTVVNPALPHEDFAAALAIAQAAFDQHQPEVIVGSSRGGAVAMNLNSGVTPLVLLCPAWKKYGTVKTVRPDTVILHSLADDVVPFADSEELVSNSKLPAWALIETGSDHRLADPESLEIMLEACLIREDEPITGGEDILEKDWTGLCYSAALRWVIEAEENDWLVVHGTVLSDKVGQRIDHAWCERGDFLVDLAMPVGHRFMKREQFYGAVKPVVGRVYTADEACALSARNKHDGPWNESAVVC